MRLISKINVLKNLGKEEQGNATQMINMKVGKKYERLKKGGILSEDLQEEKTQNHEQVQEARCGAGECCDGLRLRNRRFRCRLCRRPERCPR